MKQVNRISTDKTDSMVKLIMFGGGCSYLVSGASGNSEALEL